MKQQNLPLRRKQVFCYSLLLFLVLGTGCSKVLHWSKSDAHYYVVNPAAEDAEVATMIAPYRDILDEEMNEVIGHCASQLEKSKPEGTLGNWVADAMKSQSEALVGMRVDFAINNYGGIRINTLAAGPVQRGRVFEIMPFDNLIVILEITGAELKTLMDFIASEGGWPVSRELRFAISDSTAVQIEINGEPLDHQRKYHMATSDYLANGGDGLFFLKEMQRQTPGVLLRDALISEVQARAAKGESITAATDGRIRIIKH